MLNEHHLKPCSFLQSETNTGRIRFLTTQCTLIDKSIALVCTHSDNKCSLVVCSPQTIIWFLLNKSLKKLQDFNNFRKCFKIYTPTLYWFGNIVFKNILVSVQYVTRRILNWYGTVTTAPHLRTCQYPYSFLNLQLQTL